ncbi:MAG: AgmX/PglI C-terminal domain-containing protein [Myxococcota bacterium]
MRRRDVPGVGGPMALADPLRIGCPWRAVGLGLVLAGCQPATTRDSPAAAPVAAESGAATPSPAPPQLPDDSRTADGTTAQHRPVPAEPASTADDASAAEPDRVRAADPRFVVHGTRDDIPAMAPRLDAPPSATSDTKPSVTRTPRLRVRHGRATVEGGLDRDRVRRAIRDVIDDVEDCYATGLAGDASLAGRVILELSVGRSGTVASSTVGSSTLDDEATATCIAEAAEGWRFPRAASATTASYPFVLSTR